MVRCRPWRPAEHSSPRLPPGVSRTVRRRARAFEPRSARQGADLRGRAARVPRPVPVRGVAPTTRPRRSSCRPRSRRCRRSSASRTSSGSRSGRTGVGKNNGYGGPAPRVDGSVIVSPAEHEQGARDRRGARLRRGRAGRPLVRPLRRDPGGRPQADGLDRRPRLGQRGRQLRSRTEPPTCRRRRTWHAYCGMEVVLANGEVLRTGHGRDAGQPLLARLQARASARRSTSSSCSRTSGSSRRWASG